MRIPFISLWVLLISAPAFAVNDGCRVVQVAEKEFVACHEDESDDLESIGVQSKYVANMIDKLNPKPVSVFETTMDDDVMKPLVQKPSLSFSRKFTPEEKKFEGDTVTFDFDPRDVRQEIEGFGAALTESCAMSLMRLTKADREKYLRRLFGPGGANFNSVRMPIGASDFADPKKGYYTYNDTEGNKPDPEFKHFNMSRDDKSFAILKEIQAINPNLRVMISPWSPPAWMKSTKRIGAGYLEKEHMQEYANYFVRVINEYKKRGLKVDSLTIQNEPWFQWNVIPSTYLDVPEQTQFIRDYLGPTLEKNGIDSRIFALDSNWNGVPDVKKILADKTARKYVKGAAFHCYGGVHFEMLDLKKDYEELPIIQNECSSIDSPEFPNGKVFNIFAEQQSIGGPRIGTSGSLGWNMCLDENHGPVAQELPCTNCRGLVNLNFSKKKPEFVFTPEFYALEQLSKFVKPGARRVGSPDEWKDDHLTVAAIRNPDGQMVFAIHSTDNRPRSFSVRMPDCRTFTYKIKPNAAVTFVWNETAGMSKEAFLDMDKEYYLKYKKKSE